MVPEFMAMVQGPEDPHKSVLYASAIMIISNTCKHADSTFKRTILTVKKSNNFCSYELTWARGVVYKVGHGA